MPADIVLKAMNTLHRAVLSATGGRVGWSFSGMPVVELTTTGRKTGMARKTLLTSPYQDGDGVVIVASRGGDDHHPTWYLNLVAHPEVTASVGGGPEQKMRAEVLEPDERDRVWEVIAGRYRNYAGYQKRTSRRIPLVRLRTGAGA
jgi:deazaflavin-dependent oxidoreductase (nitroreductase family)